MVHARLSRTEEAMGEKILGEITAATGLPQELVSDELTRLISAAGLTTSELTLEDLRLILSEYVQDVLLSAKKQLSE
jgi:hypothetical protein